MIIEQFEDIISLKKVNELKLSEKISLDKLKHYKL